MSEFTNSNLLPVYHSTTIITYTFIILLEHFLGDECFEEFQTYADGKYNHENKVPFICITVQQVVNLFKFEF